MNRIQFMSELNALLRDIPDEEREEALQYYNDYFDDAGEEMEDQIIEELGSPEKVADIIKQGMRGTDEETSEYRETGYTDTRFEDRDMPAGRPYQKYKEPVDVEKVQKSNRTLKIILIVLLAIFFGPIVIPLGIGLVALILGLALGIGGMLVGLVCAMTAIAVSGIICLVAGVIQLFYHPVIGLMIIGLGAIALSIGVALTALFVKACALAIPAIFRFVVSLLRRIFQRNRKEAV